MLGAKTGAQTKGFILKSLKYLGADQTIVSDASNTTFISSLNAVDLQPNKMYKVVWTLGTVSSPSAGLVWRMYLNYPSGFVSFVNHFGAGAGASPNTVTPSNGSLANTINPQLAVNNIFICEFQAQIKMGSSSGNIEFGIRNVVAGSAQLLADYTHVSVYEIVPT